MKKYDIDDNEEIEFLEKERDFEISQKKYSMNLIYRHRSGISVKTETDFEISQEEDEQLTLEKRQAEAYEREQDIINSYNSEEI